LPNLGLMFKWGGSCYLSGAACDARAYLYDPALKSWKRGSAAPVKVIEPASDYDAQTQSVFVTGPLGLLNYDPRADQWRTLYNKEPARHSSVAAIDPQRRLMVQMYSTKSEFTYYKLDQPGPRKPAPVSGDIDFDPHSGLTYHPPSKQMVIWEGGGEVWTFNTADWRIKKHAAQSASAPRARNAKGQLKTRGIYGRWQWVPAYDVFIAYNLTSENVWLYRLPAAPAEE
jgi:hypothetical protein